MTMTMHPRSRRRMSPLMIIFIAGVLPILSLVAVAAYFQVFHTTPAQPTIDDQFIPGFETYNLGTGPGVDPGISFGQSKCRFNFGISRVSVAEFVMASVDGPADSCTVQLSVNYGDGFEPWMTARGDEPLGVTSLTEEEPYAIAVAYKLQFDDAADGWGSSEEIVLQQEGGPVHLTPTVVSVDD